MNFDRKKRLILGTISLSVLVGLSLLWRQSHLTPTEPRKAESRLPQKVTAEFGRQRNADPKKAFRVKELARLKQCWTKIGVGNDKMEERALLSKECAEALSCSEEALQLMEFLNNRNIYNMVSGQIGALFLTPAAAEARNLLAALPDKKTFWDNTNYKEYWSLNAGRGCPEEEFEAFAASLNSKPCAQEALFGRNLKLVETNPKAAILCTVEALEKNIKSRSITNSLSEQMRKVPDTMDFDSLDRLFPTVSNDDYKSPYNKARAILFKKWAQTDPTAAANRIMEDPERFNPDLITPIAEAVVGKNKEGGVAWAQTFPEGPYFDAAARAAILCIGDQYPEEARKLADTIADPEIKRYSLEYIEEHQREGEEGH